MTALFIAAFLILWVLIFLGAAVASGLVPTTVQATEEDFWSALKWSALIAAILVIMGAGVWTVIGAII